VGNDFIATHGLIPASPPYYSGRFSNGPIWVDHVAGYLRLPMKPYLAWGTNFAFGGAEMLTDVTTAEGTIPSVPHQVALYLTATGGVADPNALYVIQGGGNDILAATAGSPQQLGFEIGTTTAGIEQALRQAGAKHFLIPNLFDLGMMPAGKANLLFATRASAATNSTLNSLLKLEASQPGIDILRIDIAHLLNAVKTDPTHYGFKQLDNPCLNPTTGAICKDPDHTLFWDEEHPTEFGHVAIAVAVETVLTDQD
jgi:phospholipase/lecithinase/hemolysin